MQILELRTKAGLKQCELAKAAKISPAYLCNLEKKKNLNPSVDVILRLADCLGVSVEQLLIGKKAG